MRSFLTFSVDRKRMACEQAQDKLGLPPTTIEKDFWVCWTLKKLFELPEWGEQVTFKGGTSLSKGWSLIKRFSEDIDIVINRNALGFGNDMAPDQAPSNKQRHKRLDALKKASQDCVNNTLLPLLRAAISKEMPQERQAMAIYEQARKKSHTKPHTEEIIEKMRVRRGHLTLIKY
jgi:predicted nucleotidyltransferase component of viral defense system